MQTIAVPPLSRKDIRAYAQYLRNQFGMTGDAYIRLDVLLEVLSCPLGNKDSPLVELEIVENCDLPGKYAAYYPNSNLLRIREGVYLGACAGNGRDRFTIAHELGHLFLHRDVELTLARSGPWEKEIPPYRDPEWQANTFASEFLIPHDMVQGMTPQAVAKKCGTSYEAARIALKQ